MERTFQGVVIDIQPGDRMMLTDRPVWAKCLCPTCNGALLRHEDGLEKWHQRSHFFYNPTEDEIYERAAVVRANRPADFNFKDSQEPHYGDS